MIYDSLSKASVYRALHAGITTGFDYLLSTDLLHLPTGKQTIDGEYLFALVNDYSTQPLSDCRFEAHRRYIDIQCMACGVEQIGVTGLDNVALSEEYSPERDIAFYRGRGDFITLRKGTFAIFFPHDAHQPGIALGPPQMVRKVVLKVATQR